MFTIIERLSVCLLVFRALVHILQTMALYFWKWRCQRDIIQSVWLVDVINHKQSNDLPFERGISVVSDPLHFMNILIWENNHKILLDIKWTKRDQLRRVTQISVVRAITMSALCLISAIRRSIIISNCSFEFDSPIDKLLILFNDVQTCVHDIIWRESFNVPLPWIHWVWFDFNLSDFNYRTNFSIEIYLVFYFNVLIRSLVVIFVK